MFVVVFFFAVGHPNLATYPEDWRESARTVALQRQDHWENFTREKIHRSIDRIANRELLLSFSISEQIIDNLKVSFFCRGLDLGFTPSHQSVDDQEVVTFHSSRTERN